MNWQVGQALKPLKKGPITREQLKAYADASGDNNPIHLDEQFAQQAGYPSVIVHGMLSMALMGDHVCYNFRAPSCRVKYFKTRFRKVTFPGELLTCGGEVRKVTPEGVWVNLWIKNEQDEITADGDAEIVFV